MIARESGTKASSITTVLLPSRNKKDLEDVPEFTRAQLKFVWLDRVDDAIAAALADRDDKSNRAEDVGQASGRQAARSI